ncbi:MAG TPA: tetratricopeptide repeat protein [Chthoniobacter sp.]|jgi:tetratricopeptide (TPR) repeat protein
MTRSTLFLILCLAVGTLRAADPALLAEARQARAEGIPEVAVQKLRTLLQAAGLSSETKDVATYELAVSLLAAGELEDAQSAVEPLAGTRDPKVLLLQADILAHEARWPQALAAYRKLSASAPVAEAAQLGAVECLQALGRIEEAAANLGKFTGSHPENVEARLRLASLWIDLQKLPQAQEIANTVRVQNAIDSKWKKYLDGRLLLAQKQAAPALILFDELLRDPVDLSESLLFGATLGSAEARIVLNGFEAADNVLEKFISHHGESIYLQEAFRRLDQMYAQEEHPSDMQLKHWMQKTSPLRAELAQYYLAQMLRREHHGDKAMTTLETFVVLHPKSPLLTSVYLLQADLQLDRGNLAAAEKALDDAGRLASSDEERAQIDLRSALVNYRQGESLLAEISFHRAARNSEKLRVNAMFDAALTALDRHNYESYFKDYRELASLAPSTPLLSDLELEEGFTQARLGDPHASDTLELFLHHFPKHPRQNEARVALAELALQGGDRDGTARYLQTVAISAPDPATTERAAYLAVFLADAATPPEPGKVIDLSEKFLRQFPRSPFLPEVRMKLGQTYFQTGDHANAETQFTLLAREDPTGPYAETALFLAGQAATKWLDNAAADRALRLFDEVVKRDGPLKLYARQQQAIVKGKLGNENEAVTIYDAILSAQPPPPAELKSAALCGKAENLQELGRKDPAQFEAAIAVYDSLAKLPDVTPAWRNQALYKKGHVLEQLGREPEALTAYYDVLDKTLTGGGEFFWFYKAGFAAAHLFEQDENWKAAIGIYQKMSKIEGPRAAEAKARLNQLRLEKFIWD